MFRLGTGKISKPITLKAMNSPPWLQDYAAGSTQVTQWRQHHLRNEVFERFFESDAKTVGQRSAPGSRDKTETGDTLDAAGAGGLVT